MGSLPIDTPAVSTNKHFRTCTIFQWNARGLRSKLPDFKYLARVYRFPFMAISESRVDEQWAYEQHYDAVH